MRTEWINKVKPDPKRYDLYLSDAPKNIKNNPEMSPTASPRLSKPSDTTCLIGMDSSTPILKAHTASSRPHLGAKTSQMGM